jgi:hypothetical protein
MHTPGKMMRHTARQKGVLGSRLVVVFKQLPGDPTSALVINVDSIARNVDRDELLNLLQRPEGQQEEEFATALHKANYLQNFHKMGYLKKVPVDQVEMTPQANHIVPLREVIDKMNESKGLPKLPTTEQLANISSADPRGAETKQELSGDADRKGVAKSIYIQGKMMLDEANRKLQQAYDLDPTLRQELAKSKAATAPNVDAVKGKKEKKTKKKKD